MIPQIVVVPVEHGHIGKSQSQQAGGDEFDQPGFTLPRVSYDHDMRVGKLPGIKIDWPTRKATSRITQEHARWSAHGPACSWEKRRANIARQLDPLL